MKQTKIFMVVKTVATIMAILDTNLTQKTKPDAFIRLKASSSSADKAAVSRTAKMIPVMNVNALPQFRDSGKSLSDYHNDNRYGMATRWLKIPGSSLANGN